MRLHIVRYGRPAHDQYRPLSDVFRLRLQRFTKVELTELKAKHDKERHAAQLRDFLAKKENSRAYLIVLDERGRSFSTRQFSTSLSQWKEDPGIQEVIFVIGDPFGIPPDILESADCRMRLSDLTFTSDLAELILWEQIYRAFTILQGIPYHNE